MKKLVFLFGLAIVLQVSANPFLVEVNKEWLKQPDINLAYIDIIPNSQTDAIQLHLQLVERTLRSRSVAHLNKWQQINRIKCLNILHSYWKNKTFPKNEDYSVRTPIFIDKYNTFCAVGHLMKETGFENIAREINTTNSLVYLRDIKNDIVAEWINWSGLSMEECAWIQPGYSPGTDFKGCGKGTNGTIRELHSLGTELLVLGDFTLVDSSINSLGIAKWKSTGGQYVWEDYSQGIDVDVINGQVRPRTHFNAVIEYNGILWLGGEQNFNSSTPNAYHLYQRGSTGWQLDSSLRGQINNFKIYKNDLYACGNFSNSSGKYFLAKYDHSSSSWELLFPTLTNNPMYDMEVYNGNLIIGGGYNISYLNCYNIFSFDGTSIWPMYTGLLNTVHTIEVHQGKLFAAGRMKEGNDIYNMKYWNGNVWLDTNTFNLNVTNKNHIACLKSIDTVLYYGGNFNFDPFIGTYAHNFMSNYYGLNWGIFDSTINDIELFDGKIYMAGAFTSSSNWRPNSNHIAYINSAPTSTIDYNKLIDIVLYPNPAKNSIHIKAVNKIVDYIMLDVSGKRLKSGKVVENQIDLSSMSPGVYLLYFKDILGQEYLKKVFKE